MTSTYLPSPQSRAPATSSRGLFSADEYASVERFFRRQPALAPTPLTSLPQLANTLGLGTLLAKDETARFGLNAFKLLGARFAIEQLMHDGAIRTGDTLVCASEDHGRAVAHTARNVGCSARVYLSNSVAQARADAIAGEGAVVVRVPGTYDDAVRVAATEASTQGWHGDLRHVVAGVRAHPAADHARLQLDGGRDGAGDAAGLAARRHLRAWRRRRIAGRHRVTKRVAVAHAASPHHRGAVIRGVPAGLDTRRRSDAGARPLRHR